MGKTLDKNLTHFGPVPLNVETKILDCTNKNSFKHRHSELYKDSSSVDYSSRDWVNDISSSFEALNEFVPLKMGDAGNEYQDDEGVWILVISIKRRGGKPYYHYLANHNRQSIPFEPWSSAKFLSSAAALSKARKESLGRVGGQALVNKFAISDIITSTFSYTPTRNVHATSNELANFLHRSATEEYADTLITEWLKIDDGSSFYGKYGNPTFNPGSNEWGSKAERIILPFDYYSGLDQKSMSLLTIGEWIKRLIMHESDPITAMPHLKKEDVLNILYGNTRFPKEAGGAIKGTSLYLTKALTGLDGFGSPAGPEEPINLPAQKAMETLAGKNWRIFQKMGQVPLF